MSDSNETDESEMAEMTGVLMSGMPSAGWVVHEVHRNRETTAHVWAWCKVGVDEPGYTEIVFTTDDGSTPADQPADFRLGAVITKLWC